MQTVTYKNFVANQATKTLKSIESATSSRNKLGKHNIYSKKPSKHEISTTFNVFMPYEIHTSEVG
jgi:hypothetical protein